MHCLSPEFLYMVKTCDCELSLLPLEGSACLPRPLLCSFTATSSTNSERDTAGVKLQTDSSKTLIFFSPKGRGGAGRRDVANVGLRCASRSGNASWLAGQRSKWRRRTFANGSHSQITPHDHRLQVLSTAQSTLPQMLFSNEIRV